MKLSARLTKLEAAHNRERMVGELHRQLIGAGAEAAAEMVLSYRGCQPDLPPLDALVGAMPVEVATALRVHLRAAA